MIRILIAGDNQANNKLLSDIISSDGFDLVSTASSTEEALRFYDMLRPDIIIIDLGVAMVDGCKLISTLCRRFGFVHGIAYLKKFSSEQYMDFVSAGGIDYVTKKDTSGLKAKILRILSGSSQGA